MNKNKELLRNIMIFGIGTFGVKIFQMLLVPLYTVYLTTSEYSVADIISSTTSLISPVLTLGVSAGIFRFLLGQPENEKSITKLVCLVSLAGTILISLVLPVLNKVQMFGGYAYMLPIIYGLSSLSTFLGGICKAREKNIALVVGGILTTLFFSLICILFLSIFHWGIKGYFYAIILGDGFGVLYYAVIIKLHKILYKARINIELTKNLFRFSFPLIPNDLSWWIIQMSDRYMIVWLVGASLNGVYSMAYKIPGIFNLIVRVFVQAFGITAIKECDTGKTINGKLDGSYFEFIYRKYLGITFIAVVLTILFSRPLAYLFLKNDFYQAWKYIPFLLVAYAVGNLQAFYVGILSGIKKTNITGLSTTCGMIANVILNLVLIPKYQAYGAAIATIIGYVVVYLIRLYNIQKIVEMNNYFPKIIVSFLLILFISVFYISENTFLLTASFVLSIIVFLIYRNTIKEIFIVSMRILVSTWQKFR